MDCDTMAAFFKTLGNPNRLRIVRELTRGERCVGEVKDSIQTSQAAVSQHLTILKRQGVVACRRDKNMRCYYLRNPELVKRMLVLVEDEDRRRGDG